MPRLFFALWPDDRVRAALTAQRDVVAHDYRGRPMRPDTLHLTLVFVGQVPELKVPTLIACGDRVHVPSFRLDVDARSHFKPIKLAWLGCTEPPDALHILQSRLRAEIERAGFELDDVPFEPHITLARSCTLFPAPQAVPHVDWHVESFVLVDSHQTPAGPLYRVLKFWTLDP